MPRLTALTSLQLTGTQITYSPPGSLPQYTGLTLNSSSYNEGQNIVVTITTANIGSTSVGYTVTGISTSDLQAGTITNLSGTILIENDIGTITFVLANDGLTEGTDTFTITLNSTDSNGNSTGSLSASATISDTSNDPTVIFWLDNNDNPVTVRTIIGQTSMQINGVFFVNPTVPRTIEGRTSGARTTINAITARTGTFIEVDDSGNSTSFVVGETLNIVPQYAAGITSAPVNEGSSKTVDVATSFLPNGTTLYWTTASTDLITSSGSFVINNNFGSFSVTPTADATTEGTETFTVSIRTGSTSGPIVATTDPITINDTSTTP